MGLFEPCLPHPTELVHRMMCLLIHKSIHLTFQKNTNEGFIIIWLFRAHNIGGASFSLQRRTFSVDPKGIVEIKQSTDRRAHQGFL